MLPASLIYFPSPWPTTPFLCSLLSFFARHTQHRGCWQTLKLIFSRCCFLRCGAFSPFLSPSFSDDRSLGFSRLWWLRFACGCHPRIQRESLGSPDSLTQCRALLVLMTEWLSGKGGESLPEIHPHGAHWHAPEKAPLDRAANQLFLFSSFVRCETFRFKSEKVPWNYTTSWLLCDQRFLKEVPEFQVFTASS